jgi:hypothetical protein
VWTTGGSAGWDLCLHAEYAGTDIKYKVPGNFFAIFRFILHPFSFPTCPQGIPNLVCFELAEKPAPSQSNRPSRDLKSDNFQFLSPWVPWALCPSFIFFLCVFASLREIIIFFTSLHFFFSARFWKSSSLIYFNTPFYDFLKSAKICG